MADFEQKLMLLAERGTEVGPEELIERVEQELAARRRGLHDRHRRRGSGDRGETTPSPWRGVAWAIGVFVAVIAIGSLLYFLAPLGENEVVDTTPPTTVETVTPTTTDAAPPTTLVPAPGWSPEQDVALLEAAVAAWYRNDPETVNQLLRLPGIAQHAGWTDDDVRQQMEYDAAIGGRLEGITCVDPSDEGQEFECRYSLRNMLTDAVGLASSPVTERVTIRVVDGELVLYDFPNHHFVAHSYGTYLALSGEFAGYGDCYQAPLDAQCAQIQLEHLDGWVEWNQSVPEEVGLEYIEALYSGDCAVAWAATDASGHSPGSCPPSSEYELAMGGEIEIFECESRVSFGTIVSCDAVYSNVLSKTVGAAPVSVAIVVRVAREQGVVLTAWLESAHPQDQELLRGVRRWALDAGQGDVVDAACGVGPPEKTPSCATFILDNLDAWAAWYPANN